MSNPWRCEGLDLAEGRDLLQELVMELVLRQQVRQVPRRVVVLVVARRSLVGRLEDADLHGVRPCPAGARWRRAGRTRRAGFRTPGWVTGISARNRISPTDVSLSPDSPQFAFTSRTNSSSVRSSSRMSHAPVPGAVEGDERPVTARSARRSRRCAGAIPEPVERLALRQPRLFLVLRPVPVVAQEPLVARAGPSGTAAGPADTPARRAAQACPRRRAR